MKTTLTLAAALFATPALAGGIVTTHAPPPLIIQAPEIADCILRPILGRDGNVLYHIYEDPTCPSWPKGSDDPAPQEPEGPQEPEEPDEPEPEPDPEPDPAPEDPKCKRC